MTRDDRKAALNEVHQLLHEEYHEMTRDDFVQMARKSGFFYVDGCLFTDPVAGKMIQQVDKQLERFAALVAAAAREACIADCKKFMRTRKSTIHE